MTASGVPGSEVATPKLAVTGRWGQSWPAMAVRSRSATFSASSAPVAGSSTTNSSPP